MSETSVGRGPVRVEFDPGRTNAPGRVSGMAAGLIGSEILKIAADIRALLAQGHKICNLTVGDFKPAEFRIPALLEEKIQEALKAGETNYPPSDGMPELRRAVLDFYERWMGVRYPLESVVIASGSRPAIYSTYRAVVDPGDRVVYPVPSWNNNHYCHLTGAEQTQVPCSAANAFLPTPESLAPALRGARLLALNSPLNPTGTAFSQATLAAICDLVLAENSRRGPGERPLYVLYDQVYWMLTFAGTRHQDPVGLRPEMAPYTLLIDGISKPFAATGLRVGWALGPPDVIARMAHILGHAGAWAPRAEQVATGQLLDSTEAIREYHAGMKRGVQDRLQVLFDGITGLRAAGHPVDAISPMGAIYLSARFELHGRRTPGGATLRSNEDIRRYLLESAGLAIVPFQAFGMPEESGWFRLSVGAVSLPEIGAMLPRLRAALEQLA